MTAREALKLSKKWHSSIMDEEYINIKNIILGAAKIGKTLIHIEKMPSDKVRNLLIKEGYIVCETITYGIKWKENTFRIVLSFFSKIVYYIALILVVFLLLITFLLYTFNP